MRNLSQMEINSIITINISVNVIWAKFCNCWKFKEIKLFLKNHEVISQNIVTKAM